MPITIRPFTSADVDNLARYGNNPNIENWLDDGFPSPYTPQDAANWVERAGQSNPPVFLAVDLDGETIGGIGVHGHDNILRRNLEIGYWIGEPFWGNGYITEAIKLMTAYAFREFPAIERLYARPFGNNLGSQRALEKAGFTREALLEKTIWKNGRWEDELIYALRRSAYEN